MKVNLKKLREGRNGGLVLLEGMMIMLIFLNLAWVVFDFAFTALFFQNIISSVSLDFFHFYKNVVHPDFLLYDLIFVCIFLLEFTVKWVYCIYHGVFKSWAAYPFVYWYELLGCLPFGSFRFLRLLRIVSLVIRLQKREVIDVTDTWWFKLGNRYYEILIEEISDRVAVNVLKGVQKEMQYDEDTIGQIVKKAIIPNQDKFAAWIASRVQFAVNETYSEHKDDFRKYVDETVAEAVTNNADLQKIELIPVFGKQISKALSSSIADISFNVIDKMMQDLSSDAASPIVSVAVDIGLRTVLYKSDDKVMEEVSKAIVNESIEVLKVQVNKKQYNQNNS